MESDYERTIEIAQRDIDSLFRPSETVCWLCLRPLLEGQLIDRHHLVPNRLRAALHRNLVWVHRICHILWHKLFDNNGHPEGSWDMYYQSLVKEGFGYAVFFNAKWLRNGRVPPGLDQRWQEHHPTGGLAALSFSSSILPTLAYKM